MNIIKIRGKNNKGKKILIISGVHGNELTPIYCTYLLSKCKLDKSKFKKITIISSINKEGVSKNTREIPSNGTNDLNRMFDIEIPINLKQELDNYIRKHDIIIDIHSSPKCNEFMLLNVNNYTNSYVDFCEKYDISYLVRYSSANTIKKYCMDLGKVSFTLELNQMDYIDYKSAEKGLDIISKVIINSNCINITKSKPVNKPYVEVKTYKSGLVISSKKCGDIVSQGDWIATVMNINNFDTYEIVSEFKGKHKIVVFGHTSYTDASNSICLMQPL